jgi:hypothetical protein
MMHVVIKCRILALCILIVTFMTASGNVVMNANNATRQVARGTLTERPVEASATRKP